MHFVLGRNILLGCQRYGIKVTDYRNFYFRGCSFNRFYTNMTYINVYVDYFVVNLLSECIH